MQKFDGASRAWLFTLVFLTLAILGLGTQAVRDWLRERDAAREAQDARSPEEAFRDLWAALERRDAAEAALYVPTASLQAFKTGDEVIDSFLVLSPVKDMRIARSTTTGDKAVLFARASSEDVTDEKGRPAPIDIIVRMVREDGHWKVLAQRWLVSTPPATEQRDALAWLKGGR
jgi:hypothetical protein